MHQKGTPPPSSPYNIEIMDFDDLYEDDVVEILDDEASAPVNAAQKADDSSGEENVSDSDEDAGRDDATYVFTRHEGSIFCCHLDPKSATLAITGGEDETAYLWEVQTGDVVLECTGHKDSVTCVVFSHDASYVSTGDMSGIVQVWKISNKVRVMETHVGDLVWLRWHHGANVLLAGTEVGDVYMWKIPAGDCKVLPGHGSKANCGRIMPDGKRAVIGYGDGSIKIFDLKAATVLFHFPVGQVHTGTVTDMDCHPDNNLVITGGIDGNAVIIKTQTGKVTSVFDCKPAVEKLSTILSVEAVGFCPDSSLSLAAAGSLDGVLSIWDVSRGIQRHKFTDRAGITKLNWIKNSPLLYTACLDGNIRLYDARSGTLQNRLCGHENSILDMSLSMDGYTLLTGSDDNTARVFSIQGPDR